MKTVTIVLGQYLLLISLTLLISAGVEALREPCESQMPKWCWAPGNTCDCHNSPLVVDLVLALFGGKFSLILNGLLLVLAIGIRSKFLLLSGMTAKLRTPVSTFLFAVVLYGVSLWCIETTFFVE